MHLRIQLCLLILLSCLLSVRAAEPDFKGALQETLDILSRFIKVDTSNPPGNETKGALYLKTFFDRERIPSEILELEAGRGNIAASPGGQASPRAE